MTTETYDDGTGTYTPATMTDEELVAMVGEDGVVRDELHRRHPVLAGLHAALLIADAVGEAQWYATHTFDAMAMFDWVKDPVLGATYREIHARYNLTAQRVIGAYEVQYTPEGRILVVGSEVEVGTYEADGGEIGTFDADGGEWQAGVTQVLADRGYRTAGAWSTDVQGVSHIAAFLR